MIFEPFRPFVASDFQVKFATEAWEFAGAARLRHQVFCEEQRVFETHDRDEIDTIAIPIVALSLVGGGIGDEIVGTVRIHQAEPGVWWGSRLAVAADYRRVGPLGTALIKLAVSSANARGCRRFLANVQAQNGLLFRRLHWRTLETFDLHGLAHLHMEADLDRYPPHHAPEAGLRALSRKAA